MRRLLGTCLAILLSTPALCLAGEASDDELPGQGAEAPPFTLPVYNAEAAGQARAGTMLLVGEDVEDQGTKTILVSFMASYCKPCKKELPWLQELHAKYKPNGLRIIGVAIDSEAEGQKLVGELLKENKISFPVGRDAMNFVARRYLGNKVPLPSVFVIDRAGKIAFVSRGYSSEISATLLAEIEKSLGVPPTPPPAPEPAPVPVPEPKKPAPKKGKEKKK